MFFNLLFAIRLLFIKSVSIIERMFYYNVTNNDSLMVFAVTDIKPETGDNKNIRHEDIEAKLQQERIDYLQTLRKRYALFL